MTNIYSQSLFEALYYLINFTHVPTSSSLDKNSGVQSQYTCTKNKMLTLMKSKKTCICIYIYIDNLLYINLHVYRHSVMNCK